VITATGYTLAWGPQAGADVRTLAATDEGRGHLRWICMHNDAPLAARQMARAALAAYRMPLPQTPPLQRNRRNVFNQSPRRTSRT
jgi:hypothetical protein